MLYPVEAEVRELRDREIKLGRELRDRELRRERVEHTIT